MDFLTACLNFSTAAEACRLAIFFLEIMRDRLVENPGRYLSPDTHRLALDWLLDAIPLLRDVLAELRQRGGVTSSSEDSSSSSESSQSSSL